MKRIFLITILIFSTLSAFSFSFDKIRFFDEKTDTTTINGILSKTHEANFATPNERVGFIARQFLGLPYVAHTLEGDNEMLTINTSQLDCTTFVEAVIALAYTVGEGGTSWRDYAKNLERIRYRDGNLDGYASRLHYISDWIINNSSRNNFSEVTKQIPNASNITKTINFMSTHRDSYKSLADNDEYAKILDVEKSFVSHQQFRWRRC